MIAMDNQAGSNSSGLPSNRHHRYHGDYSPEVNSQLLYELMKEYYKLAPRVSVSTYGLIAVIIFFFWGLLPHKTLIIWGIICFATATLLLASVSRFRRHGNVKNADYWLKVSLWLAVLHDVPLGFIGPMGFMSGNEHFQLLTLFMLGGMAAGAITTRGVIYKVYAVAMVTLLFPTVIFLAMENTALANGMLVLIIIFFIFMLSVAKNYSSTIANNFLLWLDNEKLLGQLTTSHSKVEETNRVLTREIEHRRKIESELVSAKERSERASEAKNQFLANVSHELRTPLNGIIGFADLLQDEKLNEKQARFASQIGKSGQTLLRIVNDILDITAIEAGHLAFYEDTFSLRAEIENVIAILQPMADRKSLELSVLIDEEVEDNLYADANRLRQVVSNLLSNALKYTEKGYVRLHVSRQGERDDQVVLRFDVEDSGIGISAEAMTSIFDNFTRVEGFETRNNEGVGLGLAIVKSLLQKMDGVMKVTSTPGEGSCFSAEIPFVRSVTSPKSKQKDEVSSLTPEQWREMRVLIVDDNDVNRMVLAAFLSKAGIHFAEADGGIKALEMIREGGYDVVLMDIQMPDISGTEVAMQLNEEKVAMPVLIAVTAHAFPEQRQAILDSGFADFLIKPISEAALFKTLTRAYMGGYNSLAKEVSRVK